MDPTRTGFQQNVASSLDRLAQVKARQGDTAGALAASWSGAGPTLIGIVRAGSAASVCAAAEAALGPAGVPGRVAVLQADRRGIVYGDEADVPL